MLAVVAHNNLWVVGCGLWVVGCGLWVVGVTFSCAFDNQQATMDARRAIQTANRELAQSTLHDAEVLGGCLDEETVEELRHILALNDDALFQLQLRRSVENNDEATALAATMAAKRRFFAAHPDGFPFHRFPRLRSPQEFGAAHPSDPNPVATGWTMLTHSTDPIYTSLTVQVRPTHRVCRHWCASWRFTCELVVFCPLQPPRLAHIATQAFVSLMGFMGDRETSVDPAELAAVLLHVRW